MALTKLDPNVIGQDSTGTGKITSAGGSVSIDSSGNVRIANASANSVLFAATGNVGIGTTPSSKLHVADSVTGNVAIIVQNGAATANDGAAVQLKYGSTEIGSMSWYWTGSQFQNKINYYGDLAFTNQGTEKIRFGANGNVGIGCTSPSVALSMYGNNIRQQIQSSTDSGSLTLGQWDGTTNRIESGNRPLFLTSYSGGIVLGANGSQQHIIAANGFVGIGTTTPSARLEVGGTNPEIRLGPVQTSSGAYMSYDTTNNWFTLNAVTQGVAYRNICFATDGGNVGVNTTAPQERFHQTNGAQMQNGGDREIRKFFNISASTTNAAVFTVNIGADHTAMYYEIITFGGDWGSHSAARVIKRGFINGSNQYTGWNEIESSGLYAANIIGSVSWSTNSPTYYLRLDTGTVGLRGMVRLVGQFSSYTVYGS